MDSVGHQGSSVTMYADGNVCNVHVCVCACLYVLTAYMSTMECMLHAWVPGCMSVFVLLVQTSMTSHTYRYQMDAICSSSNEATAER